jgi:hypothetical protein
MSQKDLTPDPKRAEPIESEELSDEALEQVAGGCQIGTSVGDFPLKTTVEPPDFDLNIDGLIIG